MQWLLVNAGLALVSLAVLGLLVWRVFGALKELKRAADRSGRRVHEIMPAFEHALAALSGDQHAGRQRRHGRD